MTKRFRIFVLLSMLAFGCVAPQPRPDWTNPQEVSSRIKTQYDNFKKVTTFTGPNCALEQFDSLFIRAWKADATSEITYQIYVNDYHYYGWIFYSSAFDENGIRLDVDVLSQDIDFCDRYGCAYNESVGINVSRDYLMKHQDGGIRFKLIGKTGEEILHIPGGYIRAFLNAAK